MTTLTNNNTMTNEAKNIAARINRVVTRWNSNDVATRFNSCVDFELEELTFENETAKGLFRTVVCAEFSKMSNYRMVFPSVTYR